MQALHLKGNSALTRIRRNSGSLAGEQDGGGSEEGCDGELHYGNVWLEARRDDESERRVKEVSG